MRRGTSADDDRLGRAALPASRGYLLPAVISTDALTQTRRT
ncbi:hypothetical protein [Caudoviricetes sp.]|nr:hypothetical protein [Caudoviricetes sp.]